MFLDHCSAESLTTRTGASLPVPERYSASRFCRGYPQRTLKRRDTKKDRTRTDPPRWCLRFLIFKFGPVKLTPVVAGRQLDGVSSGAGPKFFPCPDTETAPPQTSTSATPIGFLVSLAIAF